MPRRLLLNTSSVASSELVVSITLCERTLMMNMQGFLLPCGDVVNVHLWLIFHSYIDILFKFVDGLLINLIEMLGAERSLWLI